MKKQGKKWMLVVLALLAVVTVTLPLVGCKNDSVSEQTGGNAEQPATPGTDDPGTGDGNQGTGDGTGSGDGNQGSGDPEQPETYTVSFKTNGGGFIDSQTIVSGQTVTKPTDPTLEDNVFDGWYSDEDLTSEYDFTTSVTGSFTLYAKWVKRIEVTAYDVYYSEIAELTGDGSYILVATGEWSSDDLSRLANELKDESKKVNLDLSEAAGLTRIGLMAFEGCDSLTSISIPEGVKDIGGSAFSGCSGLTSISIPSSVGYIGDFAFLDCSGLTSIDIPEGVTTIGAGAFQGCSGLTSITIPASVTSIWDYAFEVCSELTTVTMKATTPPALGIGAFDETAGNLQILVPNVVNYTNEDAKEKGWEPYKDKIIDQTS